MTICPDNGLQTAITAILSTHLLHPFILNIECRIVWSYRKSHICLSCHTKLFIVNKAHCKIDSCPCVKADRLYWVHRKDILHMFFTDHARLIVAAYHCIEEDNFDFKALPLLIGFIVNSVLHMSAIDVSLYIGFVSIVILLPYFVSTSVHVCLLCLLLPWSSLCSTI